MKKLKSLPNGAAHCLMGCVHTRALPGSPLYDRHKGMQWLKSTALEDARALHDAGFDSLLFCNESDMPYQTTMPSETIAAVAEIIAHVTSRISLPHGVNMLLDPSASLALSHASGGEFIRGFLTGSYVGDMGHFTPDAATLMRKRTALGAEDILVIANVTAGFSYGLDQRPVGQRASGAVFAALADAVCVGGAAAGVSAALSAISEAAQAVKGVPVVVGTGVSIDNIVDIAQVAHGSIIGTSIKLDGMTLNAVDPKRALQLVRRLRP
jgi:uncharacterized protein